MSETTSKTVPLWKREFGEEYAIPAVFENCAHFEDMSWHNDACPRFKVIGRAGDPICIFIEHPDQEMREDDGPRFHVSIYEDEDCLEWVENIYQGDDLRQALRHCGLLGHREVGHYVEILPSIEDGDLDVRSEGPFEDVHKALEFIDAEVGAPVERIRIVAISPLASYCQPGTFERRGA